MQENPGNYRPAWSWAQFGISFTLIAAGLFSLILGGNAGFGGETGIDIVDWLVGDGQAFFLASPFIAGAGVVWMVVLLVRRFRKRL